MSAKKYSWSVTSHSPSVLILLAQAASQATGPFRDSSLRNPRFHIWDYVGVCAC